MRQAQAPSENTIAQRLRAARRSDRYRITGTRSACTRLPLTATKRYCAFYARLRRRAHTRRCLKAGAGETGKLAMRWRL